MLARPDCPLERIPEVLAEAARILLQHSKRIKFVDGHFDSSAPRFRKTLKEFLRLIHEAGKTNTCQYHYLQREHGRTGEFVQDNLPWLTTSIPRGMVVDFFCWQEKAGGDMFHARYILTEKGGLRYDVGLDEGDPGETTDISHVGPETRERRWAALETGATVYELVLPVVRIDSTGEVSEVEPSGYP